MAQKERDEFKPGDHVSWKYGVGKATGRIISKVTEDTKLGGRTFRATPDDPKYRMMADKTGKEVVRRGAVLLRIEESAEAADDKYDGREESEHTDDSDEEKAAHKSEEAVKAKSKTGEKEAGDDEGKKDADEGSKDPPSAGSRPARSQGCDAQVPKPTIKAGLITGEGGDEALPTETDETLDLTKHGVQLGADEALQPAPLQEGTVDEIPMEEESAWQLGNQQEPVDNGAGPEEQPPIGQQKGGEQRSSEDAAAGQVPESAKHQDATGATSPRRLPHEEVPQPQPDRFSKELLP